MEKHAIEISHVPTFQKLDDWKHVSILDAIIEPSPERKYIRILNRGSSQYWEFQVERPHFPRNIRILDKMIQRTCDLY